MIDLNPHQSRPSRPSLRTLHSQAGLNIPAKTGRVSVAQASSNHVTLLRTATFFPFGGVLGGRRDRLSLSDPRTSQWFLTATAASAVS